MKQLLLLVAVYALIINQSNKHFFKKAKPKTPPVPALTKSATPQLVYPPHMSMAAMITRFTSLTIPKAQQ
jgi:hypothetical protein